MYAAASLRDVALDLGAEFERRSNHRLIFNFAGSNTLAQQILAARQADVFVSADRDWVDVLERAGALIPDTRRDVLSNRLVLVAHRDARWAPSVLGPNADVSALEFQHLAMADPQAVPAGRYAKAALQNLRSSSTTAWQTLADRIVPTLDVRAALALVESDPSIAAVVYRTDARTSSKVRVLHEFAPTEPIAYCATLIDTGRRHTGGGEFLSFLNTPEAQEIARRHGVLALQA